MFKLADDKSANLYFIIHVIYSIGNGGHQANIWSFDETSIQARRVKRDDTILVEATGLTHGALYAYFDSRDALACASLASASP